MNDREARTTLLVPIDYLGISPTTLDTLVHIARLLNRRLLGLVLESPRLQRVAELPFATEILLGSGVERSLGRDHLSRYNSQLAAETRRRLLELAQQARIELSFETDLGERWHAALNRLEGSDIFIPPRRRWQRPPSATGRRPRAVSRLGLLLGNDALNQRLVKTTLELAEAGLVASVYVLCPGKPDLNLCAPLLRSQAHCHLLSGAPSDAAGVADLIRRSQYDLLIIPREQIAEIPSALLDAALEEAGGQVMVVS